MALVKMPDAPFTRDNPMGVGAAARALPGDGVDSKAAREDEATSPPRPNVRRNLLALGSVILLTIIIVVATLASTLATKSVAAQQAPTSEAVMTVLIANIAPSVFLPRERMAVLEAAVFLAVANVSSITPLSVEVQQMTSADDGTVVYSTTGRRRLSDTGPARSLQAWLVAGPGLYVTTKVKSMTAFDATTVGIAIESDRALMAARVEEQLAISLPAFTALAANVTLHHIVDYPGRPSETPTPTPTPTATSSATASGSATGSASASSSATGSAFASSSATASGSATGSATASSSPSSGASTSASATSSASSSANWATPTATASTSGSATATSSAMATSSATATSSASGTSEPSSSSSATASASATASSTPFSGLDPLPLELNVSSVDSLSLTFITGLRASLANASELTIDSVLLLQWTDSEGVLVNVTADDTFNLGLVDGQARRVRALWSLRRLGSSIIKFVVYVKASLTSTVMTRLFSKFFAAQIIRIGSSFPPSTSRCSLVKNIRTGSAQPDSNPLSFTEFNNRLYFGANNGINGTELWSTDGTSAGTQMVKDIIPGSSSGLPASPALPSIFVFNNTLYFGATNVSNRSPALWSSDGTPDGTTMVSGVATKPSMFTVVNNTLFFSAEGNSLCTELWSLDGTSGKILMVKDINPGTGCGNPKSLTAFKNKLYFVGDNGEYVAGSTGRELWSSDGTPQGTFMVKDINPTTLRSAFGNSPPPLTVFNDRLFFGAEDGTNGNELWSSDGTPEGTLMVKDINPDPRQGSGASQISVFNNSLYFAASWGGKNGTELWSSDGTSAGTLLVKDIYPGFTPSVIDIIHNSFPSSFTVFNNRLYFSAYDRNGTELWSTDGTSAGTQMVKDIRAGGSSSPTLFTVFNSRLYFVADDGMSGSELWSSDGTAEGTSMVWDINPGASGSEPQYLTIFNDKLYFSAKDATNGRELWSCLR